MIVPCTELIEIIRSYGKLAVEFTIAKKGALLLWVNTGVAFCLSLSIPCGIISVFPANPQDAE
jgi:hypothetical protein